MTPCSCDGLNGYGEQFGRVVELCLRYQHELESVDIEAPADQYFICVYRRQYKTVVSRLSEEEFTVLDKIATGVTLGSLAKDFDLSCIALFIQKGWVEGFTVSVNNV